MQSYRAAAQKLPRQSTPPPVYPLPRRAAGRSLVWLQHRRLCATIKLFSATNRPDSSAWLTEEGKRCHRFCNRSAGQDVAWMENSHRNHHARSDGEDNSVYRREQQRSWETNVVIIQRAWRATLDRKQSWHRAYHRRTHHQHETAPLDPFQSTAGMEGLGQDMSTVG
ncbi:hypothetical protein ANANG_G00241950 [Anguilla anguilla]|uniref:Uncharacterized protein n=1 Tax=Anguilla anguilla TaxID=7936 RepID=A0A9D3RNX7_ANGAN|nr:hypothetical protein ANANG_G00241950 [Anguilla anguilla]